VTKEEAIKHERPLSDRTILLSINGTIGNLAYYNSEKCMLGKSACYININEDVSVPFMYYHFLSAEFQFYIEMVATGTTIPNVPLKGIRQYTFNIPSEPEQNAIASVLSSLDDKIDLLQRQNQTLEQMAETLFRQWFVEEFDNANYVKLGKLVNTVDNRGKTPPWSEEKTEYPLIEVNALGNRLVDYSKIKKYVDEETFTTWFRAHPKKYDTLLSTVGSIGEFSMFIEEYGSIAQNVVAFRAKGISPFYLYQTLKFFSRDIKEFDIGSVQPSIKVSHLREYEIPVCTNSENLKEFDKISLDICSKLETNQTQIVTLTALRDTLLPKLMSGEVRVQEKPKTTAYE
jgi:type I restriction enzyme S subunit